MSGLGRVAGEPLPDSRTGDFASAFRSALRPEFATEIIHCSGPDREAKTAT